MERKTKRRSGMIPRSIRVLFAVLASVSLTSGVSGQPQGEVRDKIHASGHSESEIRQRIDDSGITCDEIRKALKDGGCDPDALDDYLPGVNRGPTATRAEN